MLQHYADEQGFKVFKVYVDDGYTGLNFERPGFKQMIEDIEDGKIGIVLCKDMSRLGRLNALVSYYTEIYFVENNIRFIAMNDGIDTEHGENEIMPFKAVLNEYYSRDLSKKLRTAFRAKAMSGQFISPRTLYGYIKSPDDHHKLIIDEEAANVVRDIFRMMVEGLGMRRIAIQLYNQKVLIPIEYARQKHNDIHGYVSYLHKGFDYEWHEASILAILRNPVYTGNIVYRRKVKKSYKSARPHMTPPSEWIIVPNMHEAIVSQETYDRAQESLKNHPRFMKTGVIDMFSGLVWCADCGGRMSCSPKSKYASHNGYYVCATYRESIRPITEALCTSHRVNDVALNTVILNDINDVINSQTNPDAFEPLIRTETSKRDKELTKQITQLRRRDNELTGLIKRVFEQNAIGKITDSTFDNLYKGYTTEQNEVKLRIEAVQKELTASKENTDNVERFKELISHYTEPLTELSREILMDLVEKIMIHEPIGTKGQRNKPFKVEIYYRFVGLLR
jgi:DNA invertase Pin-like site-specific DNA recombinase